MESSKTGKEATQNPAKTQGGMPPKLAAWRQKLSDKAKQEKNFKFYSLFDLVCHPDTLRWAWTLMRRNHGAAGVDGVTFEEIEQGEGGVERFLQELKEKLKSKTYKAKPVQRVYIEKPNGKLRRRTDKRQCFKPVPQLIGELNRQLRGWANYYNYGYPRKAFRDMNCYARERLCKHLKRRSQRLYKKPEGKSYYEHLNELGLITL